MKQLITILVILIPAMVSSQLLIKPGNQSIEYKRIADEVSNMKWYLLQDTTKIEIGSISSAITTSSDQVTVVSTVQMRQATRPWIDTTIAERSTLKPIYHSSYNSQRDMIIRFDTTISGYYADKQKGHTTAIADSSADGFFDSNMYPTLIRWLPLRTGFTKDLAIYDFNPNGKKGQLKASIVCVRQCDYLQGTEIRKVWVVTVKDEIASGTMNYFIDVETRKLWKMVMSSGERKMMLEAV
jgi:hypothetical protein